MSLELTKAQLDAVVESAINDASERLSLHVRKAVENTVLNTVKSVVEKEIEPCVVAAIVHDRDEIVNASVFAASTVSVMLRDAIIKRVADNLASPHRVGLITRAMFE